MSMCFFKPNWKERKLQIKNGVSEHEVYLHLWPLLHRESGEFNSWIVRGDRPFWDKPRTDDFGIPYSEMILKTSSYDSLGSYPISNL